jgi:hypothetical protein
VFPDARRRSSSEAAGFELGRDLDGVPGWCVQVQCARSTTPERKLDEAIAAAGRGERPIAFTRRSSRSGSGEWLVTLRASDFLDVFRLAARLAGAAVSSESQ